jgi:SRSO17 transposase
MGRHPEAPALCATERPSPRQRVVEIIVDAISGWWLRFGLGSGWRNEASVGVTRQYCGQLGKRENCQVAVSLSIANHDASLPVAYRLYLPEDWAADAARRDRAGTRRVTVALARRMPRCPCCARPIVPEQRLTL